MKRHRQSHTRHNNSDTPKSKPLCPKVKKEATSALTGTAAPSGAGTSIQMRIKPNTATIGTPNPKVQVEDDLIVHNLVAVDESGQVGKHFHYLICLFVALTLTELPSS